MFLSMIGLYGVLAFAVSRRTRKFGVRMVLGAQTTDVLNLVVGQGLRLLTIGAFIGLITAFASTRLIKGLLYGVGATDPITFAAVVFLMIAVALLACHPHTPRQESGSDNCPALRISHKEALH